MMRKRKYRFWNYHKTEFLQKGLKICLKNWKYIPTAIRTLFVINQKNIVSWSNRDSQKEQSKYPFASEKEKSELLRRVAWLCNEVIVSNPDELIAKMPEVIGRQFQGQWALYACSMTACALCNLIRLYPELKNDYLNKVIQLIDHTNTPVIRFYDTMWWKDRAFNQRSPMCQL